MDLNFAETRWQGVGTSQIKATSVFNAFGPATNTTFYVFVFYTDAEFQAKTLPQLQADAIAQLKLDMPGLDI
ncbi:hypothetical protein APT56_05950 [Achromobacter denitrificans]|nr:hypothetical protein APT56_05950 [Achromobacter denitrificans]